MIGGDNGLDLGIGHHGEIAVMPRRLDDHLVKAEARMDAMPVGGRRLGIGI